MITEFVVTTGETRKRLDKFLVYRERDISRSNLQRLIQLGRIRVNAKIVKPSQNIKPGDRITMDTPQPGPLLINGKPAPWEILYEDSSLLVVNKPAGVVVHPSTGNWAGTLVNAVLAHFQNTQRKNERDVQPGLVHRLDKETSGVMVMAKTAVAHRALGAQFEDHSISRTYEALVVGIPKPEQGVIELSLGRDIHERKKVSSSTARPQNAVTMYRVVERFGNLAAHLKLCPRTGRTHQLRVHMASQGWPILGDGTYGGKTVTRIGAFEVSRVMLHAGALGFQHPSSKTYQEYSVKLPSDMQRMIQTLRDASE